MTYITKALLQEIRNCPNCSSKESHMESCVLKDFKSLPLKADRKIRNKKLKTL
jgi:hypothetical protein